MSWTAQIIDRTITNDGLEVAVVLADGVTKFVQRYRTDGTLASVRAQVLSTIARQEQRKVVDEVPVGTVINTTPDAVTPVVVDAAQQTFLTNLATLQRAARAQGLGLTTSLDLMTLRTTVQATLTKTPAYEALL